jgi:hypothetical protein
MQLVAQDYAEVVAALKASIDTRGHERRESTRMEIQAQVKIHPFAGGKVGQAFTCMTRDISFRGIGLLQAKPSPQGSQFVVVLPKQEGKPLSLLCTVMYSRPLADSLYNVGAVFNAPFDFDKPPVPAPPRSLPADPEAELKRIRQSILD